MGGSATLPPDTARNPQIQQALFSLALDQASTKFGENRMINASVAEFQTQGILPRQPISYSQSLLAIGHTFQKLKDGHERQPPRSESGLTMGWK
jgi:hypothetical protein